MTTPDVNVYVIDLPTKTGEMVTENDDGSYSIFINARFSHERQLESYEHAMRHVKDGDFDLDCGDVQEIEARQHCIQKAIEKSADVPKQSAAEFECKVKRKIAELKRRQEQTQKKLEKYETMLLSCGAYDDESVLTRREQQMFMSV